MLLVICCCATVAAAHINTVDSVISGENLNNIVIHNISFNDNLKVFEGNKIVIQDTIINHGKNSANNFWIKYYLKDKNEQRIYLGERHINKLNSGKTDTKETELKIPEKIIPKNQKG